MSLGAEHAIFETKELLQIHARSIRNGGAVAELSRSPHAP